MGKWNSRKAGTGTGTAKFAMTVEMDHGSGHAGEVHF